MRRYTLWALWLISAFFILLSFAFAETITFYAIPSKLVTKFEASNIVTSGKFDSKFPARSTFFLTPLNTDYYLISNPPQGLIDNLVQSGRAFLYQTYEYENQRMRMSLDNSQTIPLEKDWQYSGGK